MSSEGLSAVMDAATSGDAAASARLEAHFRSSFPEAPQEGGGQDFAAPLGSAGFGPTTGSLTDAEMAAGVPPSPANYMVEALKADAPALAGNLANWAHGARLTVDQVAALDRLIAERLDQSDYLGGHALPESVVRAQAERAIGSLPPTTIERARAAWHVVDRQRPELAQMFDQLDLATDPRFIELLARSWRG